MKKFRRGLPPPEATWPWDVSTLYRCLHERLFDQAMQISDVIEECGIRDHNISTRFAEYVGQPPKAHLVTLRLALAKRLLQDERLRHVGLLCIAQAVGYASQSGFGHAFRRRMECTPNAYRERVRIALEKCQEG